MKLLPHLFENNKKWAARIRASSPEFFSKLAAQQTPEYLWIGCSDSRVPANEIVGLLPGELFVHRNIANLVIHTDMNCLLVLQYAVDILKIKHVIVCGHYGCGGIKAAMENQPHGLVDNWLRHIRDTWRRNQAELETIPNESERNNRLCELNVLDQVINVGNTTIVQDAWRRGQSTVIHGWIYDLADGLLKDLGMCISSRDELRILQKEK
ncbi:MAG: carbonate dehydratase [Verrucomicrobia bacterium]|nr:carbonate dehydratase [Verrucomicrobiota bacterium]MBU4292208.1 carbonate dehydratase [Verrucomicrobiota bacterium]MBU4496405.1 carbonate dehydratase [Verrucomicrobiota bacterium]MCG2678722.1 carbonate dehydratase [Kiritimatiellia bacterium]